MQIELSQPGDSRDESKELTSQQMYTKFLGRSLLAGYCDSYLPDFVLMGVPKVIWEFRIFAIFFFFSKGFFFFVDGRHVNLQ